MKERKDQGEVSDPRWLGTIQARRGGRERRRGRWQVPKDTRTQQRDLRTRLGGINKNGGSWRGNINVTGKGARLSESRWRGITNTSYILRGSQEGEGRRGGGNTTRWKVRDALLIINMSRSIQEGEGAINWVNLGSRRGEGLASTPMKGMGTSVDANLRRFNVAITPLTMIRHT